jgi:hypothetical protein
VKNVFRKTTVETANAMAKEPKAVKRPAKTLANAAAMSGIKATIVAGPKPKPRQQPKEDRLGMLIKKGLNPFDRIREQGERARIVKEEGWRKSATAAPVKSLAPASKVRK